MAPVRLGAVDYLNARPLVYGLREEGSKPQAQSPSGIVRPEPSGAGPDFVVRFDLPAICARLLSEGAIDLGLVPSIAYFDQADAHVVPGVGIASDGDVASVAIFTRQP